MPDRKKPPTVALIVGISSAVLLLGAWQKWLPINLTESFGFVTGAICVWLVTRGNIWNWPIGLANNIFFAILFFKARLYADLGLQGVYLLMGIYGWWFWLRGGPRESHLPVSHTTQREWIAIIAFVTLGTFGLRHFLIVINGAAPFLDALTTILCLAAQYLLCKKRIENWFLWIAADLIYIPLFLSKNLPLAAILYAVFLALCIHGLHLWKKELRSLA